MAPYTLIPEWERPKSIGLVWPKNIGSKDAMTLTNSLYIGFIDLLIKEIHEEIKITVIHTKGQKERLQNYFGKEKLNLIQNNNIQDIWIRDFAPVWKMTDNGPVAVKGLYEPRYYSEDFMFSSYHDDEMGKKLAGDNIETIEIDQEELMLEGGNLTHNGSGLGIMTNRVVADNEHLFQKELIGNLKQSLNLKDIILVPVELGDDTGHVDGLVRFISENDVIVSEYPYPWKSSIDHIGEHDYNYAKKQLNKIAARLDLFGLKVTRMTNGIPMDSDFESAEGNYTNFLRVEDKFFIPQYGIDRQDKNAVNALIEAGIDKKNIITVPDCNDLAALGGCLNCITTHLY